MNSSYIGPTRIDKKEFIEVISSGTTADKCDAIVRATHSIADYEWLLAVLGRLLSDSDTEVRGVSVTCIGHIARIFPEADKDQLLRLVHPILSDSEISGRAEDALDDINTFL